MQLNIASLVIDSKAVAFEHPAYEGFSVTLTYVSKTRLQELRKTCLETKFDTKLGIPVQNLDQDRWTELFCKTVISNWSGLKAKYVAQMLLIDEAGLDPEAEFDYTSENAVTLLTKSGSFDSWVNSCLEDINNFRG